MNLNLNGKIALVTGAGGGIGARISARLADEGCIVYVADLDIGSANIAAARIGAAAHATRIDVTNPGGSSQVVTIDLPAGTYPFICRFHVSSGMKGTLVVT